MSRIRFDAKSLNRTFRPLFAGVVIFYGALGLVLLVALIASALQ